MSVDIAHTSTLAQYIAGWRPEAVELPDLLDPERARQLAATLDLDENFAAGDVLPPLWQWVYFLEWPATADLGPDGHPRDGHFLPPIPNRRRMFAGGRMTVTAPMVLGEPAIRHSEIANTVLKHGSTGELLFVTVRHTYHQGGTARVTEEQDLVYRSDDGASTSFAKVTEPLAAQSTPWAKVPVPNPALLFRFSALTANSHRIHYDEAYTVGTEGYPGVVVHGPLLAVYMAELFRANSAGRSLSGFEFRLRRPVFIGDAIRVQGEPTRDAASLSVVSGSETVHATANVTLA